MVYSRWREGILVWGSSTHQIFNDFLLIPECFVGVFTITDGAVELQVGL